MRLILTRTYQNGKVTLGRLSVMDGPWEIFSCYSLELPWLNNQVGISCVPEGKYPVVFEYSPKFQRFLYELKNVPNRSEIKLHPANFTYELRGCIAPGLGIVDLNRDGIFDVTDSAKAMQRIHEFLGGISKTTIHIHGSH